MKERKVIRLPGYEYTQPGGYFVTVVSQDRSCRFGQVSDGAVILFPASEIVARAWRDLPAHYRNLILDDYGVMPDHFHGILFLTDPPGHGLPEVIRAFKTYSARRINWVSGKPGIMVWRRSYYD